MVGKAKACIGTYTLFRYVFDEDKGYELLRNKLSGETPLDIYNEMKIIQNLNQRSTNKLMSLVISPHVDDGQNLSKKELRQVTKDFLKELRIDPYQAQFFAFVHTETAHRHIHILLNRVKEDGKLIADHHIGKLAQWAAHNTALGHNLISAKQIHIEKIREAEKPIQELKNLRKEIYQKHLEAINLKPRTIENYIKLMRDRNIVFIPSINKERYLQGFNIRDIATQTEMKASDVHRNMGLKKLFEAGLFVEDPNISLHPSYTDHQEKNMKSFGSQQIPMEFTEQNQTNNGWNGEVDSQLENISDAAEESKIMYPIPDLDALFTEDRHDENKQHQNKRRPRR